MFSDIANFTQISETLDPETLMLHLSDYLNELTHILQKNRGNIDKYIGDAIMAFWGAPLDDAEHCFHACNAILDCRDALRDLNVKWTAEGKPALYTRFGLHTGEAIVGNMGSSDRLNYTAIGDTINLAARLESLNKEYTTDIIVSEAVYETCKDYFVFKSLGTVKVRGKQKSTMILELVSRKNT